MEGPRLVEHAEEHQPRGDVLGDDGRQGHARHADLEHHHEKEVQQDVHHPGDGEVVQRPLGVPLGAEDGRAEVVEHIGRHPEEVDAQIHRGQVDHVLRGADELQELTGQGGPDEGQRQAAEKGQRDGRVDALSHVLLPSAAQVLGHHHVGPHGEAHEEVHQEIDQRAVGPHRRQSFLAHKAAHHYDVRRVEEQLQ